MRVHNWPIKAILKPNYPLLQSASQSWLQSTSSVPADYSIMQKQMQGGAMQQHQLLWHCIISWTWGGLGQKWECLSFNQPSWSYWTWEPDLGNFRLCCMLWSREFIPLPPNWDPQGKSLNKTLFREAHLITDTTGVQSPHCNLALVLHRGQKEHHQVWSAHPLPISLVVLRGSTHGHYLEMRSNRGTAEVQDDDNIAVVLGFTTFCIVSV